MLAGLLFLAHRLAPSPGWRTFLDVGALVFGYGSIALWLETHPTTLLHRPAIGDDSRVVQSPQLELPAPLSSPVKYHFYVGSDPAIVYSMPEHPTGNLRLNGHHHLAKTTSSLPEAEENY
jgi:hypothetical protein